MKGLDGKLHAHTIIVVFCYLVKEGKVLLIRRRKEPYKGHITIPGGKKEKGETSCETCRREITEETGLKVESLRLTGMVNNFSPDLSQEVMSLYFISTSFSGDLHESEEGGLEWHTVEESYSIVGISPFYKLISPYVLDEDKRLFQGFIQVDDGGNIIEHDLNFFI